MDRLLSDQKRMKWIPLFYIIILVSCKSLQVTESSIKHSKEVSTLLIQNQKAKTSDNLPVLVEALNTTENKLASLLTDYQRSESDRISQANQITDLKRKLSTWKGIKIAFWLLVIGLAIFSIGKIYLKFKKFPF